MPGDPLTPAEITDTVAATLEKAGTHPAHIYAFRQCGFLLTEMNMATFDDDDIAQWEDAIDQWHAMNPDAEPL